MMNYIRNLLAGLSLVFRHWRLILAFRTMPEFPTNWRNKEEVRKFFIAFVKSELALELTRLTPTKWDDHTLRVLVALAERQSIWDVAWNMLRFEESPPQRQTLRERIRDRWNARGLGSSTPTSIDDTEILVTAVRTVEGLFGIETYGS